MSDVEDVRATDPVARLLEDSWESRSDRATRRELAVEAGAAFAFLAVAIPLAVPAIAAGRLDLGLAGLLVVLYAIVARAAKSPLGAGYVVPSYLVLVPMLLLLPPQTVPLLTAVALILGSAVRLASHRGTAEELLFSVPDAWHTVGPAVVLTLAGHVTGTTQAVVYVLALLAGCLVDLVTSTLRESLALGVAPELQGRVISVVWLVDACIAPLGLLIAHAARQHPLQLVLLLPFTTLLVIVDRDRSARIAEAHDRLGLVARERTRLQAAVQRLGDAFAARLDLAALIDVVLHGSIDALDADGGRVFVRESDLAPVTQMSGPLELEPLLANASNAARADRRLRQIEEDGFWVLGVPFGLTADGDGALAIARRDRAFRADEEALVTALVERARRASADILAHEALHVQARTDPLTRLGNRRKLTEDLGERTLNATTDEPLVLMLFDLDGFKSYNDTFGHVAGDSLLARLGHKLAAAVAPHGAAYRLGGDEFCVLLPARPEGLQDAVAAAAAALEESGQRFAVTASCGAVLLPDEASTADHALQLADERMYARKHGRPSGARQQAHDVLVNIMLARQPDLIEHASGVVKLAVPVGRRLGMDAEQIDELARAAALHDVGKVGIPDAILAKPGPLDQDEWIFIRQHPILGERILNAAPALRPVARIVRAHHERFDGSGYPDGLSGEEIPLAARIVAACNAYETIVGGRCYRPARSRAVARRELLRQSGRQFDPVVVEALLKEIDGAGSAHVSELERPDRPALVSEIVAHVSEVLWRRSSGGTPAEVLRSDVGLELELELGNVELARRHAVGE